GEVAERVGKSKPTVSNRVRLLELPSDVLELVGRGELSEGHARALLSIPDHDARRRPARRPANAGPAPSILPWPSGCATRSGRSRGSTRRSALPGSKWRSTATSS